MRIFNSTVEAVKEIERDLWEMGHRVHTRTVQDKIVEGDEDYDSKELVGYSFQLTEGKDWMQSFTALGMKDSEDCVKYVVQEAQDRCVKREDGNLNPGVSWDNRPSVWEEFLEREGGEERFSYTYPERIFTPLGREVIINQQEEIMLLHHNDPPSRQLILQIFQVQDLMNAGGQRRIPCTMHYQLLRRGNVLYLIHVMRSLDLYTHLAVDLSISWLMVNFYRGRLGLTNSCQPRVIMQVGSLHGFKKDMLPRGIF